MKKNVHLYIDTNVYLTFFHFSNEDLKELKKLIALIKAKNIILYLPEQTKNEFYRNREVKIADALSRFKGNTLANQFPVICHAYEEYMVMQKAMDDFEKSKKKLLEKLQHDAEKNSLLADDVLQQLLSIAKPIDTNPDIVKEAIERFELGNPPGKGGSYGDAINWLSLFVGVPDSEDLFFISGDKDYYSKLNENKFNQFLLNEWHESKDSDLHYYKRITDFFKDHFPKIELTSETEKDIVISNLSEADSFSSAKSLIHQLREFDGFSVKQLNDIANALVNNNQFYWIRNQNPVYSAAREYIEDNKEQIDPETYKRYLRLYKE